MLGVPRPPRTHPSYITACIYSEWDRLGYVPFFPHGTLGQDGYWDTYIYSEWDRLGYVPFFPHGTLGQNGRTDTSIHGE